MSTFPRRIDCDLAARINSTIQDFRELPEVDKIRLANTIRDNNVKSTEYEEAGWKLIGVLNQAERNQESGIKASQFGSYFKDNLSPEPDSFEIPDIMPTE